MSPSRRARSFHCATSMHAAALIRESVPFVIVPDAGMAELLVSLWKCRRGPNDVVPDRRSQERPLSTSLFRSYCDVWPGLQCGRCLRANRPFEEFAPVTALNWLTKS